MRGIAQKIWDQASFNSPLGVTIAFNTSVGAVAQGDWLKVFTVSGNMTGNVDYGDGTIKNFNSTNTTTSTGLNHTYGEGFGVGVVKTVRINIPDRFNVRHLGIASFTGSNSPIPVEINRLANLNILRIQGHQFTSIPASILDLQHLTEINVLNAFGGNTDLYDNFPDVLLFKEDGTPRALEMLGHTIIGHGDGSHVGYDRLKELAGTLTHLNITNDAGNVTDFPEDFAELSNLEILVFDLDPANARIPDIVDEVTSLKKIRLNRFSQVQDLSNLSNLVNLDEITLTQVSGGALSTSLPTDLVPFTKLKTLGVFQCYTGSRADTFVNNFYDMVVANAPISGSSSDPFRNMAIDFRSNGTLSGTFQEPSGYSDGVSNGSPASPQEKRWVLVNQYKHVWTM